MELIVAALVVFGLVAIFVRFFARDASGTFRLPRVIDDSIGMWLLRRALGRDVEEGRDPFERFRRPSTVVAVRATPPARSRRRPASRGAAAASAVGGDGSTAMSPRRVRWRRWTWYGAITALTVAAGLAVGVAAGAMSSRGQAGPSASGPGPVRSPSPSAGTPSGSH